MGSCCEIFLRAIVIVLPYKCCSERSVENCVDYRVNGGGDVPQP